MQVRQKLHLNVQIIALRESGARLLFQHQHDLPPHPLIAAFSFSTVMSGARAALMIFASRSESPTSAVFIAPILSAGTTTAP